MLRELSVCDTDMKWANSVGKLVLIDLFNAGLPQTLNLEKQKNKIKQTKKHYICEAQ